MPSIKIGFILLSNSRNPIPSTRISVLNMLPFLRAANFEPHIVYEPEFGDETPILDHLLPHLLAEKFQIIYFQKVHGASAERLAKQLCERGIKTIYGVCDLVDSGMATATDHTIVVTDYLKSLYPSELEKKISVVHDGIEHPEKIKTTFNATRGSATKPLKAVLVTSAKLNELPIIKSPPNWLEVSIVGNYPPRHDLWQRIRESRWQLMAKEKPLEKVDYLKFLLNPRIRRIQWSPDDVYDQMLQADIGIIPIDTNEETTNTQVAAWKVKSENRLTMKMCVGLPVIATPIPSYLPVINQGKNGYFANSVHEWLEYLNVLRDPKLRREIGENAYSSVLNKYSQQEQANILMRTLNSLFTS